MSSSKKKKHNAEEGAHENAERWLLSYADMMTLLVCFFIIMYSMSVMNLKKFSAVAISIRSGFGGMDGKRGDSVVDKGPGILSKNEQANSVFKTEGPEEGPLKTLSEEERSVIAAIKQQLAVLRLDRTIEPIVDIPSNMGNRFRVVLTDQLFFEPGSAAVTADVREKLTALAQSLKRGRYNLVVDGYAQPVATNVPFADSWQLSAERARNTMTVLAAEHGISPRRMTLHAHGEWSLYGASRKVALSNLGEWREYDTKGSATNLDRVVVWAVMD
jgi:chemotaxis protein MotB